MRDVVDGCEWVCGYWEGKGRGERRTHGAGFRRRGRVDGDLEAVRNDEDAWGRALRNDARGRGTPAKKTMLTRKVGKFGKFGKYAECSSPPTPCKISSTSGG